MMSELSTELPKIKEVLIDERDIYLAQKIFEGSGKKPLVILGAGHVKGVIAELKLLNEGLKTFNYKELEEIPKPTIINKTLPWFIPLALISIFVISLIDSGTDKLADSILIWTLVNGTLAALGAILSLAHPLTILASFIAAPITSLSPLVGVGMVAGLVQAYCMRPDFKDLKNLSEDSNHLKKWYTNKALKILLVVIATSIGSSIGTFFAIPFIASLSL
jgi:pheromone shutdown-related protein TraB